MVFPYVPQLFYSLIVLDGQLWPLPLDYFHSSLRNFLAFGSSYVNRTLCKRSGIGSVVYASALSAGGMENEFLAAKVVRKVRAKQTRDREVAARERLKKEKAR